MPTANERKGLWFLALVAISGSGVRLWRATAPPASAAESAALTRQIARVDSARAAGQAKRDRVKQPVTTPESGNSVGSDSAKPAGPVDLDQANASQIDDLPGIGPVLAKRIIAFRDSAGRFGGMRTFCEVRGIGPLMVEKLRPLVTFSGRRSPVSDVCGGASKKARKARAPRGG